MEHGVSLVSLRLSQSTYLLCPVLGSFQQCVSQSVCNLIENRNWGTKSAQILLATRSEVPMSRMCAIEKTGFSIFRCLRCCSPRKPDDYTNTATSYGIAYRECREVHDRILFCCLYEGSQTLVLDLAAMRDVLDKR